MASQYPLRILLAEDNIVNQKVALLMLSKLGYKADLANNGQEALEMVKERVNSGRGAYDIVLMDVHMPIMNGEEATHRIRAELSVQYQPYIIALTADALDANRERFLSGGMELGGIAYAASKFAMTALGTSVGNESRGTACGSRISIRVK